MSYQVRLDKKRFTWMLTESSVTYVSGAQAGWECTRANSDQVVSPKEQAFQLFQSMLPFDVAFEGKCAPRTTIGTLNKHK
jgi:hypothetical protein